MQIFDTAETSRLLERFLGELQERYGATAGDSGDAEWAVVGIHRRGDVLARRLTRLRRSQQPGENSPPFEET